MKEIRADYARKIAQDIVSVQPINLTPKQTESIFNSPLLGALVHRFVFGKNILRRNKK